MINIRLGHRQDVFVSGLRRRPLTSSASICRAMRERGKWIPEKQMQSRLAIIQSMEESFVGVGFSAECRPRTGRLVALVNKMQRNDSRYAILCNDPYDKLLNTPICRSVQSVLCRLDECFSLHRTTPKFDSLVRPMALTLFVRLIPDRNKWPVQSPSLAR